MATTITHDTKVDRRPMSKWDLPARSLSSEKVEELQVTVEYHNVSVV